MKPALTHRVDPAKVYTQGIDDCGARVVGFSLSLKKTRRFMEPQSVDLLEEFNSEDIMSYNHAKLTYRLSKSFGHYDEQYDILPELEFELSHGRAKPDVAVCQLGKANWLRDIIRPTTPPLLAVEILSPRQALSDLTDKALDIYFPSGTLVVWVVIPHFRQVTIMTPTGQTTITSGIVRDDHTGIELDLANIFN